MSAIDDVTVTITIQSQLAGIYGRRDLAKFKPITMREEDFTKLKDYITKILPEFPTAKIDESYLDPHTIVIEFVQGNQVTSHAIADAIEAEMMMQELHTVRH